MDRGFRDDNVLVLQGGGALGSYQAGVFEALAAEGIAPTWVAGISIGAINAALIAGNAPGERVARLREFWELVSSTLPAPAWTPDGLTRRWLNAVATTQALFFGVPGFFTPRVPSPPFQRPGSLAAISYYDTTPLKDTLERLIDFERLNGRGSPLARGGERAHRQPPIFRSGQIPGTAARCAPHPGERRPAAGISAGEDWRRLLLGRRPRVEYAAQLRPRAAGQRLSPGFPGRSFSGAGAAAGHAGPGHRARERHPLLEPHAPQHRYGCPPTQGRGGRDAAYGKAAARATR